MYQCIDAFITLILEGKWSVVVSVHVSDYADARGRDWRRQRGPL